MIGGRNIPVIYDLCGCLANHSYGMPSISLQHSLEPTQSSWGWRQYIRPKWQNTTIKSAETLIRQRLGNVCFLRYEACKLWQMWQFWWTKQGCNTLQLLYQNKLHRENPRGHASLSVSDKNFPRLRNAKFHSHSTRRMKHLT